MSKSLSAVAQELVAPGKGILAADESFPTIKKRFDPLGIPSTPETRAAYREMLFSAPGAEESISGVILFDETLRQTGPSGQKLVALLQERGIHPGIKVDRGAKALAGAPGEKVTEGLDGLRERIAEYRELGATFAKWRAVITIGDGIPSSTCLATNAHALARYAALCQEGGLVPIVEPEVLMDGDHSIERCSEVTEATLRQVFAELAAQRVALEGMLLKPNMVISGKQNAHRAGVEEVARASVEVYRRTVPAAVPGIVFLSGGQSEEEATAHLAAMNRMGPHPWELSFSYGRALQESALRTWAGDPARVEAAQEAFLLRAHANSEARHGRHAG